jgi:hypothetical protein
VANPNAIPSVFGPGQAWLKMLFDINGVAVTPPTPRRFDVVQSVSFDFEFTNKPMHGEGVIAIHQGRSPGKLSGKIKFGGFTATPINMAMTGITGEPLSGQQDVAEAETHTIPATPYQVTIAPPSSGTFVEDLGVRKPDGTPYLRVTSGPTTGQYSVNESSGVYTFAAADTTFVVYIDYVYSVTTGAQVQFQQQFTGSLPLFELRWRGLYNGAQTMWYVPYCTSPKLSTASALDNWNYPELDFEVVEPSGIIGTAAVVGNFAQS